MIKFLAFLLILCILFGVEATRSLIFGAFGFIFWTLIILAGIGLIIDYCEKHNTPEKKEAREKTEVKKEAEPSKPKEKFTLAGFWRAFWPFIIFAVIFGVLIALLILTAK